MPARSTMITGQYVRTHGVFANGIPLPADAPNAAAWLHEKAGYRTALLGKAHFEPRSICGRNGSKTRWRATARPVRIAASSGWSSRCTAWSADGTTRCGCSKSIRSDISGFAPLLDCAGRWRYRRARGQVQPDPARALPHRLGRGAHARVSGFTRSEDDWFVWMSFPDPHHPWDPPEREHAGSTGATSICPAAIRARARRAEKILAQKPHHWLDWYEGRFSNMKADR